MLFLSASGVISHVPLCCMCAVSCCPPTSSILSLVPPCFRCIVSCFSLLQVCCPLFLFAAGELSVVVPQCFESVTFSLCLLPACCVLLFLFASGVTSLVVPLCFRCEVSCSSLNGVYCLLRSSVHEVCCLLLCLSASSVVYCCPCLLAEFFLLLLFVSGLMFLVLPFRFMITGFCFSSLVNGCYGLLCSRFVFCRCPSTLGFASCSSLLQACCHLFLLSSSSVLSLFLFASGVSSVLVSQCFRCVVTCYSMLQVCCL